MLQLAPRSSIDAAPPLSIPVQQPIEGGSTDATAEIKPTQVLKILITTQYGTFFNYQFY